MCLSSPRVWPGGCILGLLLVSSLPSLSAAAPDDRPCQLVAVPNVLGKEVNAVRAILEKSGLRFLAGLTDTNGTSIQQHPAAGTMVQPGTVVTVIFLEAIPPPLRVAVPDVKGLTLTAASKALEEVGLLLHATGNLQQGRVQAQSPAAGALVFYGTTVEIILANPVEKSSSQSGRAALIHLLAWRESPCACFNLFRAPLVSFISQQLCCS